VKTHRNSMLRDVCQKRLFYHHSNAYPPTVPASRRSPSSASPKIPRGRTARRRPPLLRLPGHLEVCLAGDTAGSLGEDGTVAQQEAAASPPDGAAGALSEDGMAALREVAARTARRQSGSSAWRRSGRPRLGRPGGAARARPSTQREPAARMARRRSESPRRGWPGGSVSCVVGW
jgi:hypothetical protein